VLSGRGLCDELITRPEESNRLCCVVCDLETSRLGAPYIYDISNLRVNCCSLCDDHKGIVGTRSSTNPTLAGRIIQLAACFLGGISRPLAVTFTKPTPRNLSWR